MTAPARHSLRPLFMLILCSLTLSACVGSRRVASTRPPLPAGFPSHTAAQIEDFVTGAGSEVEAFSARTSFSLDSPGQSGRFSSEIRARRDDSLLITVSPGLGIEAARALVTPDSIFVYDRIRNEVSFGAVGEAASTLGVPLGEEDLFGSLLGIFFPEPAGAWSIEATDSAYVLTGSSGLSTLVIDPTIWRVIRYEQRGASGAVVEERIYSEYGEMDGHFLPRRVVFRRPEDETTASLYYRDLEVNPADLSFDLRVSRSATRTPLPTAD